MLAYSYPYGFYFYVISKLLSVQLLSRVRLFAAPWTVACQASLSNQLPEFTQTHVHCVGDAIHHLILCHSLLLPPSIFPSIRIFSNESVLHVRWPKYWSFSCSISPSNEYSGLISFMIDWFDLWKSKGFSRVFSNTIVQKHQFFSTQLPLESNSHIYT